MKTQARYGTTCLSRNIICMFSLLIGLSIYQNFAQAEETTCTSSTVRKGLNPKPEVTIKWNIDSTTHSILVNISRGGETFINSKPEHIIIKQEDVINPFYVTAMSGMGKEETGTISRPKTYTHEEELFWNNIPKKNKNVTVTQKHFWSLVKNPNLSSTNNEIWVLKHTIVYDANIKNATNLYGSRYTNYRCTSKNKVSWPTIENVNKSITEFSKNNISAIACNRNVCRQNKQPPVNYGRCYSTASVAEGEFMFGWDWDSPQSSLITTEGAITDKGNKSGGINNLGTFPASIFIAPKNITMSSTGKIVNGMQLWTWATDLDKPDRDKPVRLFCIVQDEPFSDYVHAGELIARHQPNSNEINRENDLSDDSDSEYEDSAAAVRIHTPIVSNSFYKYNEYSCLDRSVGGIAFNWVSAINQAGGFRIFSNTPVAGVPELVENQGTWNVGEISFRYNESMPNYNSKLDSNAIMKFIWNPNSGSSSMQLGDAGWRFERLVNGGIDKTFDPRFASCKKLAKVSPPNSYPFIKIVPDKQLPPASSSSSSGSGGSDSSKVPPVLQPGVPIAKTQYVCHVVNSAGKRINENSEEDPNADPVLHWEVDNNVNQENRVSMLKPNPYNIEQLHYETYTNGKILGLQFSHNYCVNNKNHTDFWAVVPRGSNRWELEVRPAIWAAVPNEPNRWQLEVKPDAELNKYPLDCSISTFHKQLPPTPQTCLRTNNNRLLTLFY